ncbi:hypothetical protein [Halobacillus andaensis]|uniref:hypothetical protein n=1 Tax=Halobacillus andaensis TaxID=1176239 RepID=UPI003D71292E
MEEKYNKFVGVSSDKGEITELDIREIFKKVNSNIDYDIDSLDERLSLVSEALGEKDSGSGNIHIQSILETEAYVNNYVINKRGRLSEDNSFNQKLERIADYLIDKSENEEYPIMSDYAEERNAKSEIYINDDDDDGLPNGIHTNIVESLFNDHSQSLIKDYKLSEDKKREYRDKNISEEDFDKYPELHNMLIGRETLAKEIGLSKYLTHGEKEGKRNFTIAKYADILQTQKEQAFGHWMIGESRIKNDEHLSLEEKQVNGVKKPLTDLDELEKKWSYLLYFYNVSPTGKGQYFKAKRIHNELGYEMKLMKTRLEGSIHFKPTMNKFMPDNSDQERLENVFHFSDPVMIEALLKVENQTSNPVEDPVTKKKVRHKYSIPLFQMLEDKHKSQNTYIEHNIVNKFRELVGNTYLEDHEKMIVHKIIDGHQDTDKGERRENIYEYIINNLDEEYDIHKNKKGLMTIIRGITKKISNTYLDEIERDKLGILKCSSCNLEKVASDRHFGKDKRNKNGFKSVCKVCEKNK